MAGVCLPRRGSGRGLCLGQEKAPMKGVRHKQDRDRTEKRQRKGKNLNAILLARKSGFPIGPFGFVALELELERRYPLVGQNMARLRCALPGLGRRCGGLLRRIARQGVGAREL